MHNNYYFLRQLTTVLERVLSGTVISECYSQSKDELIIRFETHQGSFYIKANLGANLNMLSFPSSVERARKNSIDLFQDLVGHRVQRLRQFRNERSFSIEFDEGKMLLFKMHANRSNLILFDNNTAIDLFRKNLPADQSIDPDSLDRDIEWTFANFQLNEANAEKTFFTLGKTVWVYLRQRGYDTLSTEQRWGLLQATLQELENPEYFTARIRETIHLTLLPLEGAKPIEGNVLEVSNRFFFAFTHEYVLEREKNAALSSLRSKLQSSLNYCEKNFSKLAELESDTNYRRWADLIMANLHIIRAGAANVTLPDFYEPAKFVEIPLKRDLSPQDNATAFYRKAKNQHIETERLQRSITQKEQEILEIKKQMEEIADAVDLKTLRKKVQNYGINKVSKDKEDSVPYYEFVVQGFRIWVGKNAELNDVLTMRYASKEDLWLHAKDVAGSHVVIKHQSGKKIPRDVIERAAELAAYNSKRKNETLCPVSVTPKKFVRKRKGDPAGAVVVEREEVIMVVPKL